MKARDSPCIEKGHELSQNADSQAIYEYTLYKERYLVLFAFCVLTLSSSWQWITWAPLNSTHLLADYWNLSEENGQGMIDELSGVYMYVFVPGSFIALFMLVNYLGLRKGLIVGGILNAIGSVVRYQGHTSYHWVYIGTIFCAIAQCFTLATPPFLAGAWFGSHERGMATAIGVLANQSGSALGLGVTIVFNFLDSNCVPREVLDDQKLAYYLRVQMGTSILALLFIILFVRRDEPPTPPSLAASTSTRTKQRRAQDVGEDCSTADERTPILSVPQTGILPLTVPNEVQKPSIKQMGYTESITKAFQDGSTIALVLVFGLQVGVFYTWPTFLPQVVTDWSLKEIGWLGLLYQCSGVIGTFVIGKIIDMSQNYKLLMKIFSSTSILSITCLILSIHLSEFNSLVPQYKMFQHFRSSMVLIYVFTSLVGFSLAALNTIGFEYGTAVAFPSNEAAITGLMECVAELFGFALVTFGGKLDSTNILLFTMLGVLSISLGILVSFSIQPKRPNQ